MREEAQKIQLEVGRLLEDVGRLRDRVGKLDNHFRQAQEDVAAIGTSTEKITKRGERIEALEFDEPPARSVSLVRPIAAE
jgi:DNA recombination protein RmuC